MAAAHLSGNFPTSSKSFSAHHDRVLPPAEYKFISHRGCTLVMLRALERLFSTSYYSTMAHVNPVTVIAFQALSNYESSPSCPLFRPHLSPGFPSFYCQLDSFTGHYKSNFIYNL